PVEDGAPEPGAAEHDRENPVEREEGLADSGRPEEDGEALDQENPVDEPLGRRERGQPSGRERAKRARGNRALPGAGRDLPEEGARHLRRLPSGAARRGGAPPRLGERRPARGVRAAG